jgi:ABC-type Fe3+-siderophore transport system permease subunit
MGKFIIFIFNFKHRITMLTEVFDELNRPLAELVKVSPSQISTLAGSSAIGIISNELINQFTQGITPVIKLGAGVGAVVLPAVADIEMDARTRDETLIIGSILTTTGAIELAKGWQSTTSALQNFFTLLSQGKMQEAFSSIIKNPFAQPTTAGSVVTVGAPATVVTVGIPEQFVPSYEVPSGGESPMGAF